MIVTDDHNSYYQGYPQRLIKAVILVHPFIHIVTNYDFLDCDAEEYRQHLVSGEDNDGPEPTVVNRRNFYKLDEMRAGKGIYIPDDLIQYYNPDYIEKSPQVEAMRKFLMGLENTSKYCQAEEDGDEDADDIDHAADEFDPDADEFDPDGQRRFIADLVIMEMRNIARDVLVYPAAHLIIC